MVWFLPTTPSLFIRKLQMQWLMAGLLTYSLFAGLPVNSGLFVDKKFDMELTAAETVWDFHPIPS